MTAEPASPRTALPSATLVPASATDRRSGPRVPAMKFIAGEPMKPATNAVSGLE